MTTKKGDPCVCGGDVCDETCMRDRPSSASPACSICHPTEQDIIAAADRAMDVIQSMSDEQLFAELSRLEDGPIARALRGK